MKNVFVVALSCLLVVIGWNRPADAFGTLTVVNATDYPARVIVTYSSNLCRSDHSSVAARGQWSIKAGACKVSNVVAVLKDKNGVDHTCGVKRGNTEQKTWRIEATNRAGFACSVSG